MNTACSDAFIAKHIQMICRVPTVVVFFGDSGWQRMGQSNDDTNRCVTVDLGPHRYWRTMLFDDVMDLLHAFHRAGLFKISPRAVRPQGRTAALGAKEASV